MRVPILAVLLAAALAGCSAGGGAGTVQPSSQTSASGTDASIELTIVVPGAQGMQSGRRSPQYVSPSTLGMKVIVTDIPPAGQTASFAAKTSVYTLAVGLNQIVVPTPASATGHSEDLTYIAYDEAPVSGVIPAGAKAVGWALTTGFVVLPGLNTNNVVLSAVADGFPAPLAEKGAFGMMSAQPPSPAGAQTSLGFGGAAVPSGIATLNDAGGNDITTSAGGPWTVVGAVPSTATTAATGVPVTIAETAGSCGSSGTGPHLTLSYDGGAPATSATLVSPTDTIQVDYDGNGGAGWYAVVSAKAQTQTLTYTLSSLAVTSTSTDYSCANQTLSFSGSNETALMTVVEHGASVPYTVTVPNTPNCTGLVNAYAGNSTLPANLIPPGVATSLGAAGTTFTLQLIPVPAGALACSIEIQDANAAATGGAGFPGGTTYVSALLPSTTYQIIVP